MNRFIRKDIFGLSTMPVDKPVENSLSTH